MTGIVYGNGPMDVRSDGPLRTGSLIFRSFGGRWTLAVVAKATFELEPGESPLRASAGDAVTIADVHWGDDARQSLKHASDLVPFKRSGEVLVTGSAYTPPGQIVGALTARLAIAEVDKVVEVQGARYFDLDGNLSEPASFTRMPLRWERAAGGPGTSNPVGVPTGADAQPDQWGRIALPNLVPPWSALTGPQDVVPIIGLGPLSPDWPERRVRLHRHAATWDPRTFRERALPDDFDPAYFNAAPADQRIERLSGDEAILLENLHPDYARLQTRLERIAPVATVDMGPAGRCDLPLACETLCIDSDRGIATLTFRGHVFIEDPARPGTVVVTLRGRERAAPSLDEIELVTATELVEEVEEVEEEAPTGASSPEDVESTVTVTGDQAQLGALLPFAFSATDLLTMTPPLPAKLPSTPVLPFGQPRPVAPVDVQPVPPVDVQPAPPEDVRPVLPVDMRPVTLGEKLTGSIPTLAQMLHAKATHAIGEAAAPPPPLPFVPPPTPESEPVAPPPMLGGLAAQQLVSQSPEPPPSAPVPAPVPVPVPETPPPPPEPPPAPEPPKELPPLPVEAYPLARCAGIAASLDRRPDDRPKTLQAESLDDETWERLAAHWRAEIDKELSRHKNAHLRAYDAAYVDRLEKERGPIAAGDYARLAAAAEVEASGAKPVLEELSLPPESWSRIRRVWIARMAKDPKLGAIVRSLMDQAP